VKKIDEEGKKSESEDKEKVGKTSRWKKLSEKNSCKSNNFLIKIFILQILVNNYKIIKFLYYL